MTINSDSYDDGGGSGNDDDDTIVTQSYDDDGSDVKTLVLLIASLLYTGSVFASSTLSPKKSHLKTVSS